ncbi:MULTISPECIES: histidine phosphatase family protein [Subtercola]|uniref:Histidine phosphatase family protein n=1 Tax=Subtercola vilae TaxID=2056433 RepID=A0A4V4RG19_9MICO|nr:MULTISPECIES: histidine phosphatase family protein [Subtercola]MEA9984976.1 histidine phosphatase family protein [Subtercola sp. RTI3]TIH39924.1 histidine phosphatase family protein [Subtercola vilae]
MTQGHVLYLVRHGEQVDAEYGVADGPLSPRGERQARLIADRLGGVPFNNVWHSPLQRAAETAAIMGQQLPALDPKPTALLFDCVPTEYSPEMPKTFEPFFNAVTDEEVDAGRAQMSDAVAEFLTPSRETTHDLLITHNFVIGWFVREAMSAPHWRWVGVNQANCALTIIRYRSGRMPELVTHNDLGHLPVELRTGLTDPQPY